MKPIPAAKFLTEFGSKPPKVTRLEQEERPEKGKKAPVVDKMPSIMEEMRARGAAEGRAAGLAELEAKLEEQRHFYEKQLELERCTWASREADKVASQLSEGLRAVETAIAERTARILKPFLTEQVRQQSMESLWEALEAVLNRDQGIMLEISGPEDFLQLLREKLSARKATAVFSPNDTVEVRVRVGQTILETQLGVWLARLEELVQ